MHPFIFRKPVLSMNNQEVPNLYGSVILHIKHQLALFLGTSKAQMGSFNV